MKRFTLMFSQFYTQRRTAAALVAGAVVLTVLLGLHAMFGFNNALRTLYVLPVWLATRLGGRWAGLALVVLGAVLNTIVDAAQDGPLTPEAGATAVMWLLSLGGVMLLIARVEEALWSWRKQAMQDPLTGLLNRRALREFAGDAVNRASNFHEPLVVVVIDCDEFKKLNDTFGHHAGDHVLQILARTLESETRESDLTARTGGDEFVVVFPGSTDQEARGIMTRVERVFEARMRDAGYSTSISIGLASLEEEDLTIDSLLQSADKDMYARKEVKKKSRAFLN